MTNEERRQNLEQYLEDMKEAINNMVARCQIQSQESAEYAINRELALRQRPLFIHSGIVSILSMTILDSDDLTLSFFDWLLGYHINKDRADRDDLDLFVVKVLTNFQAQLIRDNKSRCDERFINFIALTKLAGMILNGTVTEAEMDTVMKDCRPILHDSMLRQAEADRNEKRTDVQKN